MYLRIRKIVFSNVYLHKIYRIVLFFYRYLFYVVYKKLIRQRYRSVIIKLKEKKQINVVFLVHDSAKWNCQSIYDQFQKNSKFTIIIAIGLGKRVNICEEKIADMMKNQDFFITRGMNCRVLFDFKTKKILSLEQFTPDIIFYSEPAADRAEQSIVTMSCKALTVYIPYGFMQVKSQQEQFNKKEHNLVWKGFYETPIHHQLAKKYAFNQGNNIVVSGYPKMDNFFDDNTIAADGHYWKISRINQPNIIRIIWAPHHAIYHETQGWASYNTFQIYKDQLYQLLQKRSDIEILLKPHPALKSSIVETGVLSLDEYNEFLRKWNELPNGSYYDEGNYIDLFRSSDAMILDSISFICEYMYTENPMLFLCKQPNILKTGFNEFGLEAVKNLYEAHQWSDIEQFIQNVVIEKNDPLLEKRKDFIENVLKYNKKSAGEFIVNYIKEVLSW